MKESRLEYQRQFKRDRINNKICISCTEKMYNDNTRYCESCWYKNVARRNLNDTTRWLELKELAIEQNYLCKYTKTPLVVGLNMSLDHILPRALEGSNSLNNLQWVTIAVNNMKHKLSEEEFYSLCQQVIDNKG